MAYCSSCGNEIPDDQGSSCSMCYGDPGHGHDGYYQQYLDDMAQQETEQQQEIQYLDKRTISKILGK